MAGFENDVMFAKNADFTQADNQAPSEANGLATDGQIWIGRTAINAGGTHVDVGTLTAGTGVNITNGPGSISIAVSGATVGQTITGNSGGALSPTAGNWNIVTANSTVKFVGSGSTLTQDFGISPFNLLLGGSGTSITSGSFNIGLGFGALFAVTSGSQNVAIGGSTLAGITTNGDCTAVGSSALNICTGPQNTGIGRAALGRLGSGSDNIALGYFAGYSYTSSESSNIAIGNNGVLAESNTIRIGVQGSGLGQQNRAFIAGIAGVANSNSSVTTVNTSTGQLGNDTTNFTILSTGLQLKGNNTNTAPPAGFIGQQIRGFASGVAITSTTPKTVTSISLTAGVWDISCILNYTISGGGAGYFITAITTTTNSIAGSVDGDTRATYTFNANSIIQWSHTIPAYRVLLNSTTTYYLVGQPSFSPGTCTATGRISAVRVG